MADNLEEVHEELLAWADSIGVKIKSIRPMRISGRGFGIVATENIPKDTEILTTPVAALRTKDTVHPSITKSLPKDITIHGLLAAELALDKSANSTKYAKWQAVVPSREDIQQSMPLTWPEALQTLLPTAARQLLEKQRVKFERDWANVSATFPIEGKGQAGKVEAECTRDEYLYAWLLVNTRTFYFVTPKTEKLPKEDHMVLQPVADLFNHTDRDGCHVAFDHTESFTFTTTRPYEKGEEVHISYGRHSNDFLLVEYGFVLEKNEWDEVCLDDAVLPALTKRQKEELDDVGFLGNYVLDRDTVCHRTQVAVRILAVTGKYGGLAMDTWRKFVNGLDDGEGSQGRVDALLVNLLEKYEASIKGKVKDLKKLKFEKDEDGDDAEDLNESRRDLLLARWGQIRKLVRATVERLEKDDD
ncbi:Ribosomal lysine N-methyltransferase set11 [Cytospora mali]|uniref:Ribosomal lysine N-methyltransferase set11 n=1 Tax=Cytospora mali TaxID=578113 RepID=A0A194V7K3_CYTMA|nr:Ribosomal lysine N-methyltransferase set11 [Valsa mali var. pyri (nom. inval.)]